jgi:hypothetical protein
MRIMRMTSKQKGTGNTGPGANLQPDSLRQGRE